MSTAPPPLALPPRKPMVSTLYAAGSTIYTGQGFAIGSNGRYMDVFETVESVTVRYVTFTETKHAAYDKKTGGLPAKSWRRVVLDVSLVSIPRSGAAVRILLF